MKEWLQASWLFRCSDWISKRSLQVALDNVEATELFDNRHGGRDTQLEWGIGFTAFQPAPRSKLLSCLFDRCPCRTVYWRCQQQWWLSWCCKQTQPTEAEFELVLFFFFFLEVSFGVWVTLDQQETRLGSNEVGHFSLGRSMHKEEVTLEKKFRSDSVLGLVIL